MSILDMIINKQPSPPGAFPQRAPQPQPAPISTGSPVYQAPQPSFFERLGSGAMDYLGDPTNRARMAAGFNTMRLNPDPNIARMAQSQIETQQAVQILQQQGNRTADALERAAQAETEPARKKQLASAAELVRQNPSTAKEAAKLLFDSTSTTTEAFRTKHQSAIAAGLMPGTAEYQEFMGKNKEYGGIGDEALSGISGIRKEFMSIPEVKAFQSQASAFGRINASAANPSAAGDLALIFNYMKLLDPGSVVREGEFATAQNAAGVPDRIVNIYNNALEGTRLNDNQRADFVSRAKKIYKDAENQYENYESQYKRFMSPFVPKGQSIEDYFPSFRYVESDSDIPPGVDPMIWNAMDDQEKAQWRSSANVQN